MALVITATPAAYSSLHDDLIYTVSETVKTIDSTTYPNYKFIADVYVGATLVSRLKKVQDPITGIGIFNIGQVVRNYCAATFSPVGSGLVCQTLGNGQFFIPVTVKFGEEYNFTNYYDVTVDSARNFFNHYNGRLVGTSTKLISVLDDVASNRPTIGTIQIASRFNLVPYFPTSTSAVAVVVTPNIGAVYSTTFTPSAANILQLLNPSPVILNVLQAGTITASTSYYTVQIGGQSYRFNIICEPMYTVYTVHFLNQYGGFDTKLFNKVSRQTVDIQKKDFGKLPYTVNGSGAVSYSDANGVYNESISTYSSQFREKLLLNTDLLTDADYRWLRDLVLSTMVFVEDGNYLFPVKLIDNNYDIKKVVNDDLTSLSVALEYGQNLNAQYR